MKPDRELRRAALAAYERGRLLAAARWSVWLLVPLALACWGVTDSMVVMAIGLLALGVTIGLRWRGRHWGRAARVGALLGMGPFLVAMTLRLEGGCGPAGCLLHSTTPCVVAGLSAGAIIGVQARHFGEHQIGFAVAASAVAALIGAAACLPLGAITLLGTCAGVAVASVSLVALRLGTARP